MERFATAQSPQRQSKKLKSLFVNEYKQMGLIGLYLVHSAVKPLGEAIAEAAINSPTFRRLALVGMGSGVVWWGYEEYHRHRVAYMNIKICEAYANIRHIKESNPASRFDIFCEQRTIEELRRKGATCSREDCIAMEEMHKLINADTPWKVKN